MYLTPIDKKLLKNLIFVQSSLQEYAVVDSTQCAINHSSGNDSSAVTNTYKSGAYKKINKTKSILKIAK